MPPLIQDIPLREFSGDSVCKSTLDSPSVKLVDDVTRALDIINLTTYSKTGKTRVKDINSVIDYIYKTGHLEYSNYETITHRSLYSYQLITIWEEMATRHKKRLNHDEK